MGIGFDNISNQRMIQTNVCNLRKSVDNSASNSSSTQPEVLTKTRLLDVAERLFAARGIDVANVAHVINFDMHKMAEDFVHRVGRTGRASAHGVASTFAGIAERGDLRKIERTLSIQMKRFRVRSVDDVKAA